MTICRLGRANSMTRDFELIVPGSFLQNDPGYLLADFGADISQKLGRTQRAFIPSINFSCLHVDDDLAVCDTDSQ